MAEPTIALGEQTADLIAMLAEYESALADGRLETTDGEGGSAFFAADVRDLMTRIARQTGLALPPTL